MKSRCQQRALVIGVGNASATYEARCTRVPKHRGDCHFSVPKANPIHLSPPKPKRPSNTKTGLRKKIAADVIEVTRTWIPRPPADLLCENPHPPELAPVSPVPPAKIIRRIEMTAPDTWTTYEVDGITGERLP